MSQMCRMSAIVAGLGVALTGAVPAAAGVGRPVAAPRVDLVRELGRPLGENTLKLFRAAVDGTLRRLVVAGILTPHLGVLDLDSGQWIASVDSGVSAHSYKYLYADETNHLVFLRDGSHGRLVRIDLSALAVGPAVDVPAQAGGMVCDGPRGLVYLVTPQSPSFRAYREDTLELAWSSDEMGSGISSMALDPTSGELWILDGSATPPQGLVYRFDPGTRAVIGTVTLPLPPGARAGKLALDPIGRRLVVTVGRREVRTLTTGGTPIGSFAVPATLELEAVELDSTRGRLLLVTTQAASDGEVAGVGGRLLVVGLASMDEVREIDFGRKLRSVVVDPLDGVAYLPNGDAGTVWRVDPGSGEVTGLRLGDSAEQVLPLDDGRLVINSRLGGSYLMAWDPAAGEITTFTAGVWPIPMRYLAAQDLLLVLNAWDGTISAFRSTDLTTPVGTVRLGLPAGTTDRLPDLAVDEARALAFAAYPEHAAVAVADLVTWSAAAVLPVPGARGGDIGGGPAQLLVGVDSGAGRLLAVEPAAGRVTVFSLDTMEVVASSRFAPEQVGPLTGDMLLVDEATHGCWVGRVELATADGAPTGRVLPRGDHVVAVDETRGVLWVAGVESDAGAELDVLAALDRTTLALVGAWPVGAADTVHTSFAYLPPDRIVGVGMTTLELVTYLIREPRARRSLR